MNPLLQLIDYGQSYWLDNLTRPMIRSGELAVRVRERGLRGVTSNPAIFHKAIGAGASYDAQIVELMRAGHTVQEVHDRLVVEDVREACDILRPVYDASAGRDGFVSLEVSPHLAHDTEGSVREARHLAGMVDRPNLLIKIPGTAAGIPAVERLLALGINVNITLLFSIDAYEQVAWAYIRGLEARRAAGQALDTVASVASFFLSRIDTMVDPLLGARAEQDPRAEVLMGRVAVANAKLAYQRYKEIVASERWQRLAGEGAHVQRLLWASTSTKNPRYPDLMYVEPLIGPWTVNTMPEETIAAFEDHGMVAATLEQEVDEARRRIDALPGLGIDFAAVTDQLVAEGVRKFIEPYDAMLQGLAAKEASLGQ